MQKTSYRGDLQRQVNIRISEKLYEKALDKAESVTSSVSQVIREAIINFLKDDPKSSK